MVPRPHNREASGSSSAPPQPPQTNLALLAVLKQMRQDKARQALETVAALTQVQTRHDEFQRQQESMQQQLMIQ